MYHPGNLGTLSVNSPVLCAVRSSNFVGCLAGFNGGGIYFKGCPNVTLDGCEFESNAAEVSCSISHLATTSPTF